MVVVVRMAVIVVMAASVAMSMPASDPIGVGMVVRMGVLIRVRNGDISSVIVPAAPIGVPMVMVSCMRMCMRLVAGMIVRIPRNPLRVGMSA